MAELGSNTSPLSSVVHHHETALWAPTTLFLHLLCLPFPAQLSSARKRNLFSLLKLQRRKTLIFFFFLLDHIKEKNNLEKARKFPFSPKGNKLSNCEEWRRSASSSQSSHDKCICLLCYSIHGTSLVAKSCLTCESMDCSLPGSSVHGIHQERILEWVAISFSRGSSWPRNLTQVSCIAGKFFTYWAMREAPFMSYINIKSCFNHMSVLLIPF